MAIRIDIITEGPEIVVHIAGRLSGDVTTQLIDVCGPIKGAFVLDLSKLHFTDDAGVKVIKALSEKGAKIRGATQFVQLLLDDTS